MNKRKRRTPKAQSISDQLNSPPSPLNRTFTRETIPEEQRQKQKKRKCLSTCTQEKNIKQEFKVITFLYFLSGLHPFLFYLLRITVL